MTSIAESSSLVAILGAITKLTKLVERLINPSPWMIKIEARKHIRLSNNAFDDLVKKGAIKKHSLDEYGIAKTLYNREELDEWLLERK